MRRLEDKLVLGSEKRIVEPPGKKSIEFIPASVPVAPVTVPTGVPVTAPATPASSPIETK